MSFSAMNDEITAAFAQFFFGGAGPSHSALTGAFAGARLVSYDPYDASTGLPNKQQRVLTVGRVAASKPDQAKKLADGLLDLLRLDRAFSASAGPGDISALRAAFQNAGWSLSDDGRLSRVGAIDLETGGRTALDQQLDRLRKSVDDPAAALGSAKDLVEAVAKFVLEEGGMPPPRGAEYAWLISLAFERLNFTTAVIDEAEPGAKQLRAIFKSAKTVVLMLNELRNLQGTGHGRILPTGLSVESAQYVVREATHVAELMLTTHDRRMGRARVS